MNTRREFITLIAANSAEKAVVATSSTSRNRRLSTNFNISRAIGPALGGAIIAGFGIAAPFWLNATTCRA